MLNTTHANPAARPCNATAFRDEGVTACPDCHWIAAPCQCEFYCVGCGLCHRRDEQDAFDAPEGSYCETCALELVCWAVAS